MDHAACSLEEPQPKFFPATRISPLYCDWFKGKPGFGFEGSSFSYRQSLKRFCPNPSLVVAFKKRAGMIWSVSMFSILTGINVPFTTLNGFILVCYVILSMFSLLIVLLCLLLTFLSRLLLHP